MLRALKLVYSVLMLWMKIALGSNAFIAPINCIFKKSSESMATNPLGSIHVSDHRLINRYSYTSIYSYPSMIEEWNSHHVECWLAELGYGKYVSGFAADFGGIGIDGNRLVYLGTPDQLDHIEYHLELLGVDDVNDQIALGRAIEILVADEELVLAMSKRVNVAFGLFDSNMNRDEAGSNYQI